MSRAFIGQIPRPVSDAALEAMLERTGDLAKRWALELIAALPLHRAAEIPLEQLALRAPGVIALVLGSMGSESELERLTGTAAQPSEVASVGELAGAHDHASALAAVEALRGVLWSELLAELDHPSAQLVGDLAGRLAHVCSQVTVAVLGYGRGPVPGTPAQAEPSQPAGPASVPHEPRIEIHDARGSGPAAWITSISRCLADRSESGQPFAVELIEVVGIERLRHSEDSRELQRLAGEIRGALRGELRPGDILTREGEGRYWLVAPGTDAAGAMLLAERLIAVVRSSVSHRGVPLEVAIGIATCPADGQEAAELAAQADVKLYGARAAGLSVAPPDAD